MYGEAGDDYLSGQAGTDLLDGGEGNDTMVLGKGNTAIGGNGNDVYDLRGSLGEIEALSEVTIIEQAGGGYDKIFAYVNTFTFAANIEEFEGSAADPFIGVKVYGNDFANTAKTGDDDDWLDMKGGDDFVNAGGRDDRVYGGDGNDRLEGDWGNDWLSGGNGNDTILGDWAEHTLPQYGGGNDTIYGGAGNDRLFGALGSDKLYGDAGDDYLSAQAGGTDVLDGGTGNDRFLTDGWASIVERSNNGTDTVEFYGTQITLAANVENLVHVSAPLTPDIANNWTTKVTGNAGKNVIIGQDGTNLIWGEGGNDIINGEGGADVLRGGDGNDIVNGGKGTDTLYGDAGYDTLFGGADADTLYGGTLDDTLGGDAGNDVLYGEAGRDTLRGGAGADKFAYAALSDSRIGDGIDQIADFVRGVDKIDLSQIDANAFTAGNQAFDWAGMSQPAARGGTVWGQHFATNGTNPEFVRVYADVDGDGTADMSIDVLGVSSLSAGDFVL